MSLQFQRGVRGYKAHQDGMNRKQLVTILSYLFPSHADKMGRMNRPELNKFCQANVINRLSQIETILSQKYDLQPSIRNITPSLRGPQNITVSIPILAVDGTNYPTIYTPNISDYCLTVNDIHVIQVNLNRIINRDYKNKWFYHPIEIQGSFSPDNKEITLQVKTTTGVISQINIFERIFATSMLYVIGKSQTNVVFVLDLLHAKFNIKLPIIVQYDMCEVFGGIIYFEQKDRLLNYLEQEMSQRIPGTYVIDLDESCNDIEYGSHRIYIAKISDDAIHVPEQNLVNSIVEKRKYIDTLNRILEALLLQMQ